jgi:hypothetical protein
MEDGGVRLVIDIDKYDNKGNVSHINKTIKNIELIIVRQPDLMGTKTNTVSIGQK